MAFMDSQWLKAQFSAHPKKTKADLAKALGLEPPAISKIIKGTRQVKAREYEIMRAFFGLALDGTKAANANRKGSEDRYTLATLENESGLHDGGDGGKDSDWVMPANLLAQRTKAPPEKIKVFQVTENFMEPHFKRGEYVMLDLTDRTPSPPGAFVISDGFGYMVRHCEFIPKSNPPQTKISATDKSFEPQILEADDFEIIGRVIAKMQWL